MAVTVASSPIAIELTPAALALGPSATELSPVAPPFAFNAAKLPVLVDLTCR